MFIVYVLVITLNSTLETVIGLFFVASRDGSFQSIRVNLLVWSDPGTLPPTKELLITEVSSVIIGRTSSCLDSMCFFKLPAVVAAYSQ